MTHGERAWWRALQELASAREGQRQLLEVHERACFAALQRELEASSLAVDLRTVLVESPRSVG